MARPKGSKNKAPGKPRKPRTKKGDQPKAEAPQKSSPASAAAPVSHQFKKPNADQVTRLVKALVSAGNEARSITQTSSEKIARAVENQHFDKKALMMVKSLYQLAKNRPEAFAITFPHFLSYCDDLNLTKIADENRGLPINGEEEESDEDEIADEATNGQSSPRLEIVPSAPRSDEEAA